MEKDYLVFWHDGAVPRTSIVRLLIPPHEAVRGDALANMLKDALDVRHAANLFVELDINGAVELPCATWAAGRSYDVIDGNEASAMIECTQGAWRFIQ